MGSSRGTLRWAALAVTLALALACLGAPVLAQGPASAPATAPDCNLVVVQLVDCLPFVSGTASKPPATCCSNLTAVLTNDAPCLCQLYNTSFTGPLGVNVTRAEQLPPACNVSTPSPSLCSLFGVPVPSPVPSTSPVPAPSAPVSAPTPSEVPTPSPTSLVPSVSPAPSPPVTAPSASVPSSSNVTTTSPPSPPSSASIAAYSFSAAILLLVHLLVHL